MNEDDDRVMLSKLEEEDGMLVMYFHPDLFKNLKLESGEIFYWEQKEDGKLLLTPLKMKSNLDN